MSHGFEETRSQGQGSNNLTYMTDQTKSIKTENTQTLKKLTNLADYSNIVYAHLTIFFSTLLLFFMIQTYAHELVMISLALLISDLNLNKP